MNNLQLLCKVVKEVYGKCINNSSLRCKTDNALFYGIVKMSLILKLTS